MALVRGCERAHVNSAPLSHNNGDDCVCVAALAVFVCARLIYIHAITPRSFCFVFSYTGRNPTVLHSLETDIPPVRTLWSRGLRFTSCLLSDTGACDGVQSASKAVSGSDQVVWPRGETGRRQWPHCATEVPLVSMTLPATETGRSKMAARRAPCWCLSGSKQASLILFLEEAFLWGTCDIGAGRFNAAWRCSR